MNIFAQTTSTPDANFEQALIDLGYDTGTPDGTVSTANISGVTSLDVSNKNITDLTGIEDFTSLTSLVCGFNQLTSIDVSSNTDLTVLNCFENKLINLNVQNGNNINFTYFSAEQNANLGCIFVDDKNASYLSNWEKDENTNFVETQEDCDNVYTTYVPDNNFEQALIDLGYDSGSVDNYVPTTNIIGLSQLNIANKNISDLTGIEDFKNLTDLDCSLNQLTFLQFNNSNLINLDCSSNQLTELNLPSNSDLTNLNCSLNQLTELWIYGNTSLSSINCSDNLINDFVISENTPLMNLNISLNELTNLSTNIYSVEQLNCSHNEISNLDILSFCLELNYLDCSYNQLTNLNVSENTVLTSLNCSNNQISNVDITANTSLTSIKCFSNQLTSLNVQNGNNSNFVDFDAHDNPNLTCIFVDDKVATYLNDWTIDATSIFVETVEDCEFINTHTYIPDDAFEESLISYGYDDVLDNYVVTNEINSITSLGIESGSIVDLTGIEDFTALTELICFGNDIITLDLSKNLALQRIECAGNELTSLDISGLESLFFLDCSDNHLTGIDISTNTGLQTLRCQSNPLVNIDISNNTALTEIVCYLNQLTSIDVSNNTNLTGLYCYNNQLINLDVSNNTLLEDLICDHNELTSMDIRNGNNSILTNFNSLGNFDLNCIFVDNKNATYLNDWSKNTTSTFVETEAECDALTTVEDVKNSNFTIFPNPTKETFSIKTDNKINEVKIYDVFGKLVEVFDSNENYNVSSFAKGIYLVYVKSEDGVMISKLIVE